MTTTELVTYKTLVVIGEKVHYAAEFSGVTIAEAAKRTALMYAELRRINLFDEPVFLLAVYGHHGRCELKIKLSPKADWVNPREGVDG